MSSTGSHPTNGPSEVPASVQRTDAAGLQANDCDGGGPPPPGNGGGGGGPPPPPPPPTPPVPDPSLYMLCMDGYKYRDQLVPQEFSWMTLCFLILTGFVAAIEKYDVPPSKALLIALIGIAGFGALTAFLIDLQANASCKAYLRQRMIALEGWTGGNPPQDRYWGVIENRDKTWLETTVPGWFARGVPYPRVSNIFIKGGYVLVIVWCVIVIALVFSGPFRS